MEELRLLLMVLLHLYHSFILFITAFESIAARWCILNPIRNISNNLMQLCHSLREIFLQLQIDGAFYATCITMLEQLLPHCDV